MRKPKRNSKRCSYDAVVRLVGRSVWRRLLLFHRGRNCTSRQSRFGILDKEDYLEAFKAHPQIGASVEDQEKILRQPVTGPVESNLEWGRLQKRRFKALKVANAQYLERFGYIFIVCATGKSAGEMLTIIQERLPNAPEIELPIAAFEQQITTIRLEKLL